VLYVDGDLEGKLAFLGEELRFVLIASEVKLARLADAPDGAIVTDIEGLKILVSKSEFEKCVRCWHHRSEVGSIDAHPELCQRCVDNVDGEGEARRYA
jgi:isoleucyl-tRNA synthetase